MNARIAIVREIGDELARCQLTHLARVPVDVERARVQHAAYRDALAVLGCEVLAVPGGPGLPDAVFVEDTAVVVDEVAVIARPGASSRLAEVDAVARVLARYRPLVRIEAPATLDGGDVLLLGRTAYVGVGARTNAAGVAGLAAALEPHAYRVIAVPITRCLHLKSAATALDAETVLINPDWIDGGVFAGARIIEVDPAEPGGANALAIGASLIHAAELVRTRARLEAEGFDVVPVPASEVAKCEGAVTCCSIVLTRDASGAGNVAPG